MFLASHWCNLLIFRQFSTSKTISNFYDAIIVGGGMVGNAMACQFGMSKELQNKKVLLLESGSCKELGKAPTVYANRVSAVNPSSKMLFEDSCSQSSIHFESPKFSSELAWIIENDAIISCLYDRIKSNFPNITIKSNAKLDSCRLPKDTNEFVEIFLEDGSSYLAKLLIGADGSQSKIRKSMDSNYTCWKYEQKAIVATLKVNANCENDTAWQRFTPLGPVAILPLSKQLSSLVWTTSNEQCQHLLSLNEEQFVDQLNAILWSQDKQNSTTNRVLFCIDRLFPNTNSMSEYPPTVIALEVDNRAAFPLEFGHAYPYVQPRTALIGDAAHRVHPLAGLGVNLGWSDTGNLIRVLEKAVQCGGDIGSLTYLSEFDTSSQRKNVPTMVAIDWLNRLYSNTFTPVVLARSLGLYGVNRLEMVKNMIINGASG